MNEQLSPSKQMTQGNTSREITPFTRCSPPLHSRMINPQAFAGSALGLLAGIGALAIPGVGPLIAAGPIMAALAGVGVGGAVGGFTGALIGLGIPEYEAKRYEGRLAKGGILLSVHCDTSDEIKRAKNIMKGMGAEDISSTGESSSAQVPPVSRAAGTP